MTNSTNCPNCLTPLQGNYCYQCGQSTKGVDRFFLTLVNEAFEDIFSMNSRVWKTFGNLMFRPGFLSNEYFAGRRVRYIPPVRLYFTLSILFFVLYSVLTFFDPNATTVTTANTEAEQSVPASAETDNDQGATTNAEPAAIGDAEEDSLNLEIEGLEEWNAAWLSDEEAAALKQRIEAQIIKAKKRYEQDPELIGEYFRDVAPPIIFCLLPIFALLLKLLYIFKGMYYTQHLILAVHNHCFVFMWLSILTIIDLATLTIGGTPGLIEFLVGAWFVIYLWRSLRVVYQQGRFFTTVKFLILGISYLMLGGIAAALAIIFGVLTA